MFKKIKNLFSYVNEIDKKVSSLQMIKLEFDFWTRTILFNSDNKMIYEFENNQEKSTYIVKSSETFIFKDKKLLLADLNNKKAIKKSLRFNLNCDIVLYLSFLSFPLSLFYKSFLILQFTFLMCLSLEKSERIIDNNYFIKSLYLLDDGQTCEIELFNGERILVDNNLIRKPKKEHIELMEKSPTTIILKGIPVIINGKAYYLDYRIYIYYKEILAAVLNGNYISFNENKKVNFEEVIPVRI